MTGCNPTRNLSEKQYLFYDVTIKGVEKTDPEKIESLLQQKPNRKVPLVDIMPYLAAYNLGKKFYDPAKVDKAIEKQTARYDEKIRKASGDSARIADFRERKQERLERLKGKKETGNFLMRMGEPPSIYDSLLTELTVEQISTFLSSNGYFRNRVTYETDTSGQMIALTLKIQERAPYIYTHLTYSIQDTGIYNLVIKNREATLIKINDVYDEDIIDLERNRLEQLIKNNGYYEFSKQYIIPEVDTSFGGNTVRLNFVIANRDDSLSHKVYFIKNVYFTTDAGASRFGINRDTILFNNVYYLSYLHKFAPSVLDKKVQIYPGQKYSQQRTTRTQRQITDLDMFRFTSVTYTIQKDTANLLNAYITASPTEKFQSSEEVGINYTEQVPGPFGNVRLRVRNVFGRAEILDFGLRFGFEGQVPIADDDKASLTKEYGGTIGLTFPQFLVPFNITDKFITYNPRTRLGLGYTHVSRREFTRTNADISMDYIWLRNRRLQWQVSPVDISIVDTADLSEPFKKYLEDLSRRGSQSFEKSFTRSVIWAPNVTRIFNSNNINQTLDAYYLRMYAEGDAFLSHWFKQAAVGLLDKHQTFKYVKFNVDYRKYEPVFRNQYLVTRLNLGYAQSLDFKSTSETRGLLPYDRYFFSGGGSSIRAWRPRKLGPGGLLDTLDNDPDQPGEILIEGNIEYRFNIFSFINGALFLDAGNVWLRREDPARPNAEFDLNRFYREIAVATGVGLRFDFSFVIFRFDLATRAYDPTAAEPNRFRDFNFGRLNPLGSDSPTILNIGIGYPF